MAYTPENNPYVPGDPYSYDLKWIVEEVNRWKTSEEAVQAATEQADRAEENANNAKADSLIAEGFATGEQETVPVGSGSPYYQNNAKYYAEKADESAVTAADYANNIADPVSGIVSDWLNDHITQPTTPAVDTSLSVPGAASDAAVTGNELNIVKSELSLLGKPYNLFNPLELIANNYYSNTIGTSTISDLSASSYWKATPVYNVTDGDVIIVNRVSSSPRVILYDTSGIARYEVYPGSPQRIELVASVTGYTIAYFTVSYPVNVNVNTIVISIGKFSSTFASQAAVKYRDIFEARLQKIAAIGDSITEGAGNNGYGYADMTAEYFGIPLYRYATSGSTWVRTVGRTCIQDLVDNLISSGNTPDVVILSGGYNDSQNAVSNPIGTVKFMSPDDTTVYNPAGLDNSTVSGAIEKAIYKLRNAFPFVSIVYVITYAMGEQWLAYYEKIKDACHKWAVDIVDMTEEGQMCYYSGQRAAFISSDNVHPNEAGHLKMAQKTIAKIRTNYIWR